jgi:RND superfamily putative drug exporter
VLLMRAFRSLVLPLKAILLNLLAIAASYGLLVVVFKWGVGDWAGLISFPQIEGWIPVFLFAMLFGLSMDYEVFLVSRMREEWDETGDNELAVERGLAKTGASSPSPGS